MKLRGLATIAVLSGLGFFLSTGCRRGASTPVSEGPASVERVTAGKPQRKALVLTTTQPARVEAFEQTPLYAKLAGFVDRLHVDIGDHVDADQPLVTLAIPELADEVAQKEALLSQAEAEVEQAAAHIVAVNATAETAAARIDEARAGVTRSNGEYERWQAEYERIRSLAESGSVTKKLVDETLNQWQAATAARDESAAAVKSAKAAADEATANIAQAEADKSAAKARRRVAQADLSRAKTMLGYAEIKSPFSGTITERNVDKGHFVQPAGGGAARPLLVVARTDKLRVFMDIPEMDASLVDVGDEATLSVQALAEKKVGATVARLGWSVDPSNRSMRAEVDVANDDATLRPGMYAQGTIELARRDNALVLPTSAIVRDGAETFCCCIESGKIVRRKVEIGLRSGLEIEILSGIDDDSLVVLARADALTPGQEVEVIEPKP